MSLCMCSADWIDEFMLLLGIVYQTNLVFSITLPTPYIQVHILKYMFTNIFKYDIQMFF
jgi:hypothetical protein